MSAVREGDAPPRRDGGRNGGSDRGGFVMAIIVFIIFAVGLAGTVAYQLVRLEAELAGQGRDSERALSIARAGLERFVGAHYGHPPDSTDFVIGSGTAVILTRKLATLDSVTDLYHIQSVGLVVDSRWTASPTRRVVNQHALLHKDPVGMHAALMIPAGNVHAQNSARVDGDDQATSSDCSVGGLYDRAGVANTGTATTQGDGLILGSPPHVSFGTFDAVVDSARVRWDVLTNAGFSIKHDGAPPDWATVAPDSFPVVRVPGNVSPPAGWSGRGVLIVGGVLHLETAFTWEGIILAGSLGTVNNNSVVIRGLLITGLNAPQNDALIRLARIYYHSCNALAASASIAYLEPLERTFFEGT